MISLDISSVGHKYWWVNYSRHRANGPAIVAVNKKLAFHWYGTFWFWYGKPVSEFEHMMLVEEYELYKKKLND